MSLIHPSAVIATQANIHPSTQVGPGTVIDKHVDIGPDCKIGPNVYITGHTTIGAGNRIHSGAVIGDEPQDLKYDGAPTELVIGDRNVIREGVTIHRSATLDEPTRVGNDNFFMANSHAAHNVQIGNNVALANGVLLAGHVIVEDRVFMGGNAVVHQFTRIGQMAIFQGIAGASLDIPPGTVVAGVNRLAGLNLVGLKRGGVGPEERKILKSLYKSVLMERTSIEAAMDSIGITLDTAMPFIQAFIHFIQNSKRGICRHETRSVT